MRHPYRRSAAYLLPTLFRLLKNGTKSATPIADPAAYFLPTPFRLGGVHNCACEPTWAQASCPGALGDANPGVLPPSWWGSVPPGTHMSSDLAAETLGLLWDGPCTYYCRCHSRLHDLLRHHCSGREELLKELGKRDGEKDRWGKVRKERRADLHIGAGLATLLQMGEDMRIASGALHMSSSTTIGPAGAVRSSLRDTSSSATQKYRSIGDRGVAGREALGDHRGNRGEYQE